MKKYHVISGALALSLVISSTVEASEFSIQDLVYEGASRIPIQTYGESRMGWANGTFMMDVKRNSFFVIGHGQHMAIGEFGLNGFSTSTELLELPMAENVQPFVKILERVPSENTDRINHITGMHKINDAIYVNAAQYYDGDGDNTDTTFIIEQPDDLENSEVSGYFKLAPRVKGAGWITDIPKLMKERFGGDYIFGFASNLPINSRNSMGPSAYSVQKLDLENLRAGDEIPAVELLAFSISNQLHPDHYNESGQNDLWTEISNAFTGFIVPGTNTYAVFGNSGGHDSGIGYKIRGCGGACAYDPSDVYNHYWLWDLDDLEKVMKGMVNPYDVRPYDYGRMELPFEDQSEFDTPRLMTGAYYDSAGENLYFMLGYADSRQNRYEQAPLLLKYSFEIGRRPNAPSQIIVE